MNGTIVIAALAVALVVLWFVWSIRWTGQQSLLGTWVAALPDGSQVTLQFEGTPGGGLYKQLRDRNGVLLREFGHWTMKLLSLRLIIMATDVRQHPRFGVDSQYWVAFNNKTQITINGPDRPTWVFHRANPEVKVDFDKPKL